ncbi:MAG: DUF6351 family protein [Actinomycetota bacterium]|nr:DUF6351 family protein [Actinomycetota bacterium]
MTWGVAAVAVLLLAVLGGAPALAADSPQLRVLSNRADLISGGDALVELIPPSGVAAETLRVDVDGRDVSGLFALRPGGRHMALVDGLKVGPNVVTARAPNGSAARITIENHPIGGPVIDGPQIQPWTCFEGALDAQCNRATRYEWRYKRTSGGGLQPYDPANPPSDVATTTTDEGKTVPFIVRHEIGAIDRGEYRIAVLYDPAKPSQPWAPPDGFNRKLVVTHGVSCDTQYRQTSAPDVMNEAVLARGYAVMSNSLDHAGQNCNILTQAESLIMTKERVVEQFGPLRYTIGSGCSGGSLVQQQVANAYPGFFQGITPACSFTDAWSSAMQYVDYVLMRNYFENPDKWAPSVAWTPEDIALVEGHPNPVNAITFTEAIPFSGEPTRPCPGVPNDQVYDENTNPNGVRCTLQDFMRNIFGLRGPDRWEAVEKKLGRGFAGRPFDNVGIEYGRKALMSGMISTSQFVDLNLKIGGGDIDTNIVQKRSEADRPALERVYRSGAVNQGTHLDEVAIIDLRGPDPGAFHDVYRTYAMRARLEREHGHAKNQILWRGQVPLFGDTAYVNESIFAIDRWLAAVERDKRKVPLAQKIVEDRPPDLKERCTNGAGVELEPEVCDGSVQAYSSPRIEAGMPFADDTIKCELRPLRRANYYPIQFTDEQWAALLDAYPNGVCDYSEPGVDRVPTVPWLTYREGPGGKPLGAPPASKPVGASAAGCIKGSSRTVPISRKIRGERVKSTRVNANGPVKLRAKRGRLFAVVDIRRLRGKTMSLRITRRTFSGKLVKTKHTRLVCR